MIKKILILTLLIIVFSAAVTWFFLNSLKPVYSGKQAVKGLKETVKIYYDKYGIPHIYATGETDAYFALGYTVAQDRMFQLEMFRRLASGRLSEILGPSVLKSDKFFRTIGLNRHAEWSAKEFLNSAPPAVKSSTLAYIDGFNSYLENGPSPIEFTLLGIKKSPLTIKDIYLVTGFMAIGFAEGIKTDPLVEGLYRRVGGAYMSDLQLGWPLGSLRIPVGAPKEQDLVGFSKQVTELVDQFPVSAWMGSNCWVMAPAKTKNKQTLLCNDTHMGYMQPAIFYEAHLEYPGCRFYGNFIAGLPFALTGHNDFAATGLTMFENDDTDFFIEKTENDKVLYQNQWSQIKYVDELIVVKDSEQVNIRVAETPHGPLIQDVFEEFPLFKQAVSLSWTYLKFPSHVLEATYMFNHAHSMTEARTAAAMIEAPGLNIMYGDKDGHIAWWASAKLIKRPAGQFSKRFLDGISGKDEPLGYYDFKDNPQMEDPASGYLYSANNQPDSCGSGLYPGYYVPQDRALKIVEELGNASDWDSEKMKVLIVNAQSSIYPKTAKFLLDILTAFDPEAGKTEYANRLSSWQGDHAVESVGPVIYYKWIYNILRLALLDEMGYVHFNSYMNSHLMKTSYPALLNFYGAKWWDDQSSLKKKENRTLIIAKAWKQMVDELVSQLGKDVSKWTWNRVHTIEHIHPIGRKKPFNLFFNVGPDPISGGNEVINNTGFRIDSTGEYKVFFGPSMRRIVDFSDPENSLSVLPTGQSGYFMAPHYKDQNDLYNRNYFRKQLMNKKDIIDESGPPLILEPE